MVERGKKRKKRSQFLLLPESLATVRNVLLMPARSGTARLLEQPLPPGVAGALGWSVGTGSGRGWPGAGGPLGSSPHLHSLIYLFIYLHPSILPNPSHFPWLSYPHFHSQDMMENMLDFFFFSWQVPVFCCFFFFKKKPPSLHSRNAAAGPVLPVLIPGCLPAPAAAALAPHGFSQEPKAGICRREGGCFLFLEGGSRTWWIERGLLARTTDFLFFLPSL